MAKRYIGYGMTNEHGVATLDYDADGTAISGSGYTGTGAGKIDFQAELHDDSTVVSNTYEVWDTLVYDSGTTQTSEWQEFTQNGSMTESANGRVFAQSGTGNYMVFINKPNTTSSDVYDWSGSYVIEFNVTAITSEPRLQIYSTDGSYTFDFTRTGHYKIVNTGTSVTAYYEGTQQGNPYSVQTGTARIGFILNRGEAVTVKDFKIYNE